MHRLVKLPDDKFEKMKLIVALAATAQAFVGPTARLPSASVGRTLQVKAQPNMLLGGLRARANNLVPTRRPQNSARPGSLARETPQTLRGGGRHAKRSPHYAIDATASARRLDETSTPPARHRGDVRRSITEVTI